ncbi:MAG: hypothetical protein AB7F99_13205 [Vicinamibacterales bacterium]
MPALLRVVVAILPLLATPVLLWLIGDGYLNFGAGEKDLFMAVPWFLWSLVFGVASLVFWARGLTLQRASAWAATAGVVALTACAAALMLTSGLGIAGF